MGVHIRHSFFKDFIYFPHVLLYYLLSLLLPTMSVFRLSTWSWNIETGICSHSATRPLVMIGKSVKGVWWVCVVQSSQVSPQLWKHFLIDFTFVHKGVVMLPGKYLPQTIGTKVRSTLLCQVPFYIVAVRILKKIVTKWQSQGHKKQAHTTRTQQYFTQIWINIIQ